jgi:hypothetical protein
MLACLTGVGCNRDSGSRIAVRGTVLVDAVRVARGSITFLPAPGTTGPASSTSIRDGSYRFDRQNGPLPGKYEVTIGVTPTVTTTPSEVKKSGPTASRRGEPSPSRTRQWTAECVVPDAPEPDCDFALSTANP